MSSQTQNIFVVGIDDFNLSQLKSLPKASDYHFPSLYTHREIKQQDHFPVEELLTDGIAKLKEFPGSVDAIVGYWDFPVSTVLPILREAVGIPTTSLESVLRCEHKYWSRVMQQQVVPQQVPQFALVDPFAADVLAQIPLDFPFWLKPVKSVSSYLGFRVEDKDDLNHAIQRIRDQLDRYAIPFNQVLERAELPPEIRDVNGYYCIAEAIISTGRQCTVEGYVWDGEVVLYGVIDSLREGPQGSSFSRYQYPSTLPAEVTEQMKAISQTVMAHLGYDQAPFNIEYFYEEESDRIWLLEINPRISKSHTPLFYRVDGCYHHQVMVDLALGQEPHFPHREGEFDYAAKFMVRRYEDAVVNRVPTAEEIRQIEAENPYANIEIEPEAGDRLSDMTDQDSYSYEVAVVFIGGDSSEDLENKYRHLLEQLPFEFAPIESAT